MKIICLVVLVYYMVLNVASQEINSTYSIWLDAKEYCKQDNKSLLTLYWNEQVPSQLKRVHADVLNKTSMWVENYIYFRYFSGTELITNPDPSKDKCMAAIFVRETDDDSFKYSFRLVPRNCTDNLQPICSSQQLDQNSTDWFNAAHICDLWSPSYMQSLETKSAFANGTVTLDTNTSILERASYWTDLVKKIYLPEDGCPLQPGFVKECGYVEKMEPSIQFGDCNQEKAVVCESSTNSSTDKHIERCSLPSLPNDPKTSTAVYIGVSVGGFAFLVAVVITTLFMNKRRSSTIDDANEFKRQSNVRKQADVNSDRLKSARSVNNTSINLQMNVARPGGPREFDDNKDGIAYASFNEYQPPWEGPEDFFSNEAYGTSSRSVGDISSPLEDSGYYPIHGQMAPNKPTMDNALTDGSRSKTDDETDNSYEYMEVKKSRASGNVLENSEAFVDQNTSHDVELFSVQNFTYTSI